MKSYFKFILLICANCTVLILYSADLAEAQSQFYGICNDFDHNRSYPIGVIADTFKEGANTYVTNYKVYSGIEMENKLPLLSINVSHFPPEKIIELSVTQYKPVKKPIASTNQVNSLRFRYLLTGNIIIADNNDTIPFDSTYMFYKVVYFFSDKSKKNYVYLNQIDEVYTQLPVTYILSPIPYFIYRDDSIAYARFLIDGTTERSIATWKKEYEIFKQDSIRKEDSLRHQELNNFLILRNDTFITLSPDTAAMYGSLLKSKIQEVGLTFRRMKMKYNGVLTLKADTLGNILTVETDSISADSYGYQLFCDNLKEAIEGLKVPLIYRTFQGRKYSMQSQFDFQGNAFCDTLVQTVKKEKDTLEYEVHLYEHESLSRKLSSVLTEKGRYSFVLYYCEIQGEKYYYITKLKGGGRNYGDMVFGED